MKKLTRFEIILPFLLLLIFLVGLALLFFALHKNQEENSNRPPRLPTDNQIEMIYKAACRPPCLVHSGRLFF
jgi:hypothetical protein